MTLSNMSSKCSIEKHVKVFVVEWYLRLIYSNMMISVVDPPFSWDCPLKKKKYFRFNSWIGHTNPKRPSKDDKSAQNPGPITAAGWRHCGSCRQDGQRGKHASQQAETSSGDVSNYWLAQRGAGIAHRVAQSWTRQEWREQNRKINLSLKGKVWREKHVFFSIEVLL